MYAYIYREEEHYGVINLSSSFEKSTLIFTSTRGGRGGNNEHGRGGKMNFISNDQNRLKCEHCGRLRHTID